MPPHGHLCVVEWPGAMASELLRGAAITRKLLREGEGEVRAVQRRSSRVARLQQHRHCLPAGRWCTRAVSIARYAPCGQEQPRARRAS